MSNKLLPQGSDWTFENLEIYQNVVTELATDWLGLDLYPNQVEVITAEQMLDCYSSHGLPSMYNHWSFGKSFIENHRGYKSGQQNLAYEIVINSSPSISFLMESNGLPMQVLVMAHVNGHNAFFKNNYLFQEHTDAEGIIDYLIYAKDYIADCSERYGDDRVEQLLDACHALENNSVDQYPRPPKKTARERAAVAEESRLFKETNRNDLFDVTAAKDQTEHLDNSTRFPPEPEDNFLYFFEKYSPVLEEWEREIVRICRKKAQYFYPQRLTQVSNEGFATGTHYRILNKMVDEGMIDDTFMLEMLHSHSGVIAQPDYDSDYYNGRMNPYALGFAIQRDIERMCKEPTKEDEKYFPNLVGQNWKEETKKAAFNFKDESFISQYLSPKVIRDFKMFGVNDSTADDFVIIDDIHDEEGYQGVVDKLSTTYNLSQVLPQLSILDTNIRGDRTLTIQHKMVNDIFLDPKEMPAMLSHVKRLWGFDVEIVGMNDDGIVLEHIASKNIKGL